MSNLRIYRKLRVTGLCVREFSMAETVPASEFSRNFGQDRIRVQREAVSVLSHGDITVYFIGLEEYEELLRYRDSRRSFATADLSAEKAAAIGASRMDARQAHFNAMLDE